jgi:hypothetical protein
MMLTPRKLLDIEEFDGGNENVERHTKPTETDRIASFALKKRCWE